MKKMLAVFFAVLFAVAAAAQSKKEEAKPAPKPAAKADAKGVKAQPKLQLQTDADKLSYALGVSLGDMASTQAKKIEGDMEMKINLDLFMRGLEDRLKDAEPSLTPEEQRDVMQAFQGQINKKKEEAQAKAKVQAEKNKQDGEAFLAENHHKPGTQVTPSGLQYQILQEGTGDIPKATDRVKVNYKGTLIDGTEFDSSYKRGQPAVFPVSGVIKGWIEGLQLMKVGSKYKFVIPPGLAYGERGKGKDIGPNSTLIFELELLGIEPPAPAPAAPAAPAGQPGQSPAPSAPAETKPAK